MPDKRIPSVTSTVCRLPFEFTFHYFGWPSAAVAPDGTIYAAASGFRMHHVCPFGKSVLFESHDRGVSWSMPLIVNDSPIDDRDAGLLFLRNGNLLYSWFTSDTRVYFPNPPDWLRPTTDLWDEETVRENLGSFLRVRSSDGVWGRRIKVPVCTPHGPILLSDGTLFYLGAWFGKKTNAGYAYSMSVFTKCGLGAFTGSADGLEWSERGSIPIPDCVAKLCEPHAIELKDGRILAMIRVHKKEPGAHFEIWKSISADRGLTWSAPEFLSAGSPPQLMRHSSGMIVCTYGWRVPGYGIRAMFSRDEGETWDMDWILDDRSESGDLGYPSTVELGDGSLLTVWYRSGGLYATTWTLPKHG